MNKKEQLLDYRMKLSHLSDKEKQLRDLYLRKLSLGELEGPMTGFASLDKPWLKYYDENIPNVNKINCSMFELLEKNNRYHLNDIALEYFNFKISYKNFIDKIIKCAKALEHLGVKKGEIVLLCLPNIPESRILIYALNYIGAISYPFLPTIPADQLNNIISKNNISTIFIFDSFIDKYNELLNSDMLKNIITLNGKESIPRFFRFFNKNNEKPFDNNKFINYNLFFNNFDKCKDNLKPIYVNNTTALIIGTSGTTGVPKGVCLTNENINAMAMQHIDGCIGLKRNDVILDALIQSIGYGIAVMHYSGCCGFKSILIPYLLTDKFPDVLYKTKPDHFTGGPIHYNYLANSYLFNEGKIKPIKNMVSGGASLDKNVEMKLNSLKSENDIPDENKIIVRQGLGCTENGGAASYAKYGSYKLGGVGIPLRYEDIGIFVPNTDKELKFNEEGEICIKGPTVMKEYLNNDNETKKVLLEHSDGVIWLHTADLGKIDDDGQIFIMDRIKDIFMRSGFNIHPSKIRDFLNTLPYIEDSIVVGVEHPQEVAVPVAFVILKKDCKYSDDEVKKMIQKKCYSSLDETYIPYDIYFVKEFPRNFGGKVDTKLLIADNNICYVSETNTKAMNLMRRKKI
jgi:long-chain acyl-CoA synthetase